MKGTFSYIIQAYKMKVQRQPLIMIVSHAIKKVDVQPKNMFTSAVSIQMLVTYPIKIQAWKFDWK